MPMLLLSMVLGLQEVGVKPEAKVRQIISASGAEVAVAFATLDGRDRRVEDDKAFQKGLNNTTTARGLMVLMEKLARGQAVDPVSDAAMVEILKRQKFNDAIPAGVPAGVAVAHKTGTITRIHHDAALVLGPRPYVLVVLVRGIEDGKKSAAAIADISRALFPSPAALPQRP